MGNGINTATMQQLAKGSAETRIAAYQLTEYLERLGVEVIFGLCGHTVIAFLDALRGSKIPFEARIVRMADAGVYNGMSFHRVAPGFVIQTGALSTRTVQVARLTSSSRMKLSS